ncbi:2cd831e8-c278-4e0d-8cdc-6736ab630691 [Sclerotinia trifoliorum]|uniref:2cd831e8-c278-4e0d-8cdc-6736ab630691 n=1 Tax=Sclerotinia trifoliorum TaxID=28548 RepID=A0A8H2W5B1_9HELO|nr:2cd831e8-c278-4e0d-8cdc-6736ab630691 [Sclerotinia trifoliorum]
MSSAGINGGGIGKAAIEYWLSDHRLPFRPFLRGNLEKAIRYHENLRMGSSYSSLKPVTPPQEKEREIFASDEEDEEEEDPRPAKRRKTANIDSSIPALAHNSSNRSMSSSSAFTSVTETASLNHSTTENSQIASSRLPTRSQVNKIKPTDFYGPQPRISGGSDANVTFVKSNTDRIRVDSVLKLTEPPVDFQKLLRIRVASIIQNSSFGETDEVTSQYSNIKCTLALFRVSDDEDETLTNIYRQPQTGRIKRTPGDRQIDTFPIYLPPFIIPSDVLSQDPIPDESSGRLQGSGEFGKYRVELLMEPYHANRKDWLPLTISSLPHNSRLAKKIFKGEAELTDVRQMVCEFLLFDWDSKDSSAQIELLYGGERVETSASLKLDIQWSLPNRLIKKEELGEIPKSPTPGPKIAPEFVLPHLLSPQKAATVEQESPSRAKRRGRANIPTYNLKALSAKAQGKKLRAHWGKESSGTSAALSDIGEYVTYTFSKADAEAYGIKQTHSVAGFACPVCDMDTKGMESLRLHFTTTHDRFTFRLRPKSSFFVEINKKSRKSSEVHPLQVVQLGRATTLLDMERYISGDSSWAEVREGPQNNQWPDPDLLARLRFGASPSPPPQISRRSSQEVLNNATQENEGENSVPAYIRRLASLPARSKNRHYVPDIRNGPYPRSAFSPDIVDRVFYDLRTKQVVQPGEELPDSDDEKDEAWLLHKRKWIINDYTDLTDDEKEYLIKWEEFIMGERQTGLSHLQEAIMRFVSRNRVWFAEKKARKKEWCKQIELFVARDGLEDQPLMSRCERIFELGKKELDAKNSKPKSEFVTSPKADPETDLDQEMRGGTDCVCGDFVQTPDQVMCSGELCPDRHYHKECAKKSGRSIVPKGTWLCDRCNLRASMKQVVAKTSTHFKDILQDRILKKRRMA